ncbi:HNH/ENDO VII family nuclease [Pseudogracilibacillus auburnensis]|uniref:HNH/ENDO VII family nuclease n=1 Tax=Pseudogracilibacillus auburnensis TaxID=1494959 RepID=UPI001A96B5B7|nr:HNH/ENDO VII family nuclease [Pseudogracilibacillus auburnensis]
MKNYVEEIGSMLHNGDITVLDFNPNQLRDSGALNELVGKVNPVEDGFIKFVNILSTIEPLIFFLHPDKMLPVLYRNHPVTASDLDKLKETKEYQDLSEENKLTKEEEDALRKYLHNLEPNSGGNPFAGYENPDYGPITYQDRRKVMGGNSPYAGTMEGLPLIGNVLYGAGYIVYHVISPIDEIITLSDSDSTVAEKVIAGIFLFPNPFKLGKPLYKSLNDVGGGLNKLGKGTDNGYKYWNKTTQFKNVKVYQRDDIINPNMKDARGRTNLERMKKGLAPLGPDGKSINLHHMTQRNESSIAEVTQTFHKDNSSVIHINPNTIPSGINRSEFNKWRTEYWKNRANDF